MSKPANVDFAYYGRVGLGCACIYFLMAIVGILSVIVWGSVENVSDGDYYLLLGFLAVIFLVIPVGVLVRAAMKYAIWKTWAAELGWQEPPPKERAWKQGKP